MLVFVPSDRRRYLQSVDQVGEVLRTCESAAYTHQVLGRHGITHVFIGTIERETWDYLGRFDEPRYFVEVFRRGDVRVLALIRD